MEKIAIVVVTYKRQLLLAKLFDSMLELKCAPWRVVVIDNECSSETEQLVSCYGKRVACAQTAVTWPEGASTFTYVPQKENTGGSGGFSAGVRKAYEMGAEWFWLMDDDVVVFPDALDKLARWMPDHGAVQGSRLDVDGGPFYWQYHFIEKMGIYDPCATAKFTECGFKKANALCFEGGMFSREVVEKIGYPDNRFFLYWDDCVYGYLASKVTDVVVVQDVILQRTREVTNWEVTGVRQLNSSSDTTRYCVMRNRGHMAHYLALHGDYHPVPFALGTILSFAKEIMRLLSVDRGQFTSGMQSLVKGWKESRAIIHDASWKPMEGPLR